jgi:tetratricopeptide (TPR) repeat protein
LGQSTQALASFTAAIHLDRHDANAFYFRGQLELRLGILTRAEADMRQAVALAPGDGASRLGLGLVLADLGQYAGARDQYREAVSLLRGTSLEAGAWVSLGNALDNLAQYSQALTTYRQAVRLDPTNTLAHSALGLDLLRTNQLAAARMQFTIVLAQDPGNAFADLDLALIDEQQGHTTMALAELQRQIGINQGQASLLALDYRILGLIYSKHLRWQEAATAFAQVIAQGSRTDQDYYNLGYAEEEQGDRPDARRDLGKAYNLARAIGDHPVADAAGRELIKLDVIFPDG